MTLYQHFFKVFILKAKFHSKFCASLTQFVHPIKPVLSPPHLYPQVQISHCQSLISLQSETCNRGNPGNRAGTTATVVAAPRELPGNEVYRRRDPMSRYDT
jgi:hypothetical protein